MKDKTYVVAVILRGKDDEIVFHHGIAAAPSEEEAFNGFITKYNINKPIHRKDIFEAVDFKYKPDKKTIKEYALTYIVMTVFTVAMVCTVCMSVEMIIELMGV